MVLIPIDQSTIRANPHAGETRFRIAGRTHATEVKVYHRGSRWIREEWLGTGVKDGLLTDGILSRWETSETYCPDSWKQSLVLIQEYDTFHSLTPEPAFLYEYENVEVMCEDCEVRFPHSELRSEESGDGDAYCETVCPRCGSWHCCEIEFEKLTGDPGMRILVTKGA